MNVKQCLQINSKHCRELEVGFELRNFKFRNFADARTQLLGKFLGIDESDAVAMPPGQIIVFTTILCDANLNFW